MAALLRIHNLGLRYGAVTALEDVNIDVDAGDCIGLVGKNGAGKTTLLSSVAGLLRPDTGTVTMTGPARIGLQPQEQCFRRRLPVRRQLQHLQRLAGAADAAELDGFLAELDAADYVDKPVEQLSVGQAKRLNVLQAFLGTPQLILLDEPTAGLDPVAADSVREMILSRRGDVTFLISSHNLYELQDLCRRILILDRGRVVNDIMLDQRAGADSILRLQLDRDPDEDLLAQLAGLAETTQLSRDRHDRRRLTLMFASDAPDRLQLAVQSLINDRGYSILHLSRGRTLSEDLSALR